MTIAHHPTDATLLEFAAGSLDEGQRLVMSAHLSTCPHCRRLVRALEAAGGIMLEALDPSPMAAGARERALAALDEAIAEPATLLPGREAPDLGLGELPPALRGHELGPWHWAGPGVHWRAVKLHGESRNRVFLLRAKPGTRLPEHTHIGSEMTLVLKGSFSHDGGRFAAGDIEEADGEVEHRPVVGPEGECICLVAMDGHLKLSGMIGRAMQPFVRF